MCHANNEKQKRWITKGIEQLKQEIIRSLVEKEAERYLVILEADTIKQVEMKEKITNAEISPNR